MRFFTGIIFLRRGDGTGVESRIRAIERWAELSLAWILHQYLHILVVSSARYRSILTSAILVPHVHLLPSKVKYYQSFS